MNNLIALLLRVNNETLEKFGEIFDSDCDYYETENGFELRLEADKAVNNNEFMLEFNDRIDESIKYKYDYIILWT